MTAILIRPIYSSSLIYVLDINNTVCMWFTYSTEPLVCIHMSARPLYPMNNSLYYKRAQDLPPLFPEYGCGEGSVLQATLTFNLEWQQPAKRLIFYSLFLMLFTAVLNGLKSFTLESFDKSLEGKGREERALQRGWPPYRFIVMSPCIVFHGLLRMEA